MRWHCRLRWGDHRSGVTLRFDTITDAKGGKYLMTKVIRINEDIEWIEVKKDNLITQCEIIGHLDQFESRYNLDWRMSKKI